MKNKTLFNSLFFTFSLFGSFFVLDKPLKADDSPICPDPSSTTITSVYDEEDSSSFFALTGGYEESNNSIKQVILKYLATNKTMPDL